MAMAAATAARGRGIKEEVTGGSRIPSELHGGRWARRTTSDEDAKLAEGGIKEQGRMVGKAHKGEAARS